jgi:hypothetical protein
VCPRSERSSNEGMAKKRPREADLQEIMRSGVFGGWFHLWTLTPEGLLISC